MAAFGPLRTFGCACMGPWKTPRCNRLELTCSVGQSDASIERMTASDLMGHLQIGLDCMSLHERAKIYAGFSITIFFATGILMSWAEAHFGVAGTLVLVSTWLVIQAVPLHYFFKCPTCGTSIFCRYGIHSLWKTDKVSYFPQQALPVKRCAKCGKDHTGPDANSE